MAAYISVPRDFSKVKSKVAFNLTARQLICFGAAAVVGVPLFFVLRDTAGNSGATLGMMAVMLPMFFLAMYQKNGQPAEKILRYYLQARFVRPKVRPYQTRNYYALLMKGDDAHDAAAAARSAVHREVDQYEDDNVGTQALNEGVKSEEAVSDFSKNRYARKLKKKAKLQAKKNTPTAKSSAFGSDKAQSAEATSSEGGSNWLSRWRQKQDIRQSYYAAARSGTAAQTAGGKAASNGATAAKSGMEQAIDKGKSVVSTAVNGIANFAKSNAHVLLIAGVFLLLIRPNKNISKA